MQPTVPTLVNRLLSRGKFRHVQVLLKLAELGSVQRTADAIGMTQSSVTQSLAYLERLLEIQLFLRHARGVRPTQACVDLLPVARQLLQGVEEGASVVVTRRVEGRQVVRVQGSASAISGFLAPLIARFVESFPGVQVHLTESEREDLLLAVSRGQVDIVACRRPAVIPESWDYHVLREDRFVVVCAPAHPLARRRKLAWNRLSDQPWLLAPAGSAARTRFEELAQHFPTDVVRYPVVTRVLSATWQLLHDRPCLCLLPHSFVRHLLESGALATVAVVDAPLHMEPLGVLVPKSNVGEATSWLLEFLLTSCTPAIPANRRWAGTRRARGDNGAR